MRHAKKILALGAVLSVFALIALPLLTTSVDAAAVLESEATARAAIGDSFSIEARGEAGFRTEDTESRALTKMHLEFEIVRNGTRGVMFEVTSGYLVMNYSRYSVTEGLGFAGRPDEGRFNNTIVFGFRLNMTGADDTDISVGFLGFVVRNQDSKPVLVMRGQITVDDLVYNLLQRGIIQRL